MNILALDTSTEFCSAALWLDGGLLTVGYRTLVVSPESLEVHAGPKPYLELSPLASEVSSANIAAIRIYSERSDTFPVPRG